MPLQHRFGIVACGLGLLVSACASGSGSSSSAHELTQRLNAQLAPDIAAGRASVQSMSDGARVVLSDPSLFPGGATELDARGQYVVASVIQGLLAPRLMLIQVAHEPMYAGETGEARASSVARFFADYNINTSLGPSVPGQGSPPGPPQPTASGTMITIRVATD